MIEDSDSDNNDEYLTMKIKPIMLSQKAKYFTGNTAVLKTIKKTQIQQKQVNESVIDDDDDTSSGDTVVQLVKEGTFKQFTIAELLSEPNR